MNPVEKGRSDVRHTSAMVQGHPLPNCYAPELLVLVRGDGVWLEDRSGKRYLDFAGGIAVNALGYGRLDLAEIARDQMTRLTHVSNLFATEPALELAAKMLATARRLAGRDFEAVQFVSSGSEANETALKYARLYSLRRKGSGAHKLLSFRGAFHGRTFGALSVTPNAKYQEPFLPLLPGVESIDYNDVPALERTLDESFAGVIVEVVQGEGGLAAMSREFAAALNERCRAAEVILIADEVQTGMGRTGDFFASAGVGLEPDIITLAKPLAGGLPLAAALLPGKVNSLIHTGEHGTTFGGGPVTTAVASRVWDLLSETGFMAQVKEKGELLGDRLASLASSSSFLSGVRGRGLLQGVEVRLETLSGHLGEEPMAALLDLLRDEGLLALRSGSNILRVAPPLVISREEIETGISILRQVFEQLNSQTKP
jgi:acetylornithine/N-succinyldiaminopimelate aminotransferase